MEGKIFVSAAGRGLDADERVECDRAKLQVLIVVMEPPSLTLPPLALLRILDKVPNQREKGKGTELSHWNLQHASLDDSDGGRVGFFVGNRDKDFEAFAIKIGIQDRDMRLAELVVPNVDVLHQHGYANRFNHGFLRRPSPHCSQTAVLQQAQKKRLQKGHALLGNHPQHPADVVPGSAQL